MKRCLIIGGDSSIGGKITQEFVHNSYHVSKTTRRTEYDTKNNTYYVDLSRKSAIESFANKIGCIDVVIFCTGYLPGKALIDYTDTDLYNVMEANILVVLRTIKTLLPYINAEASVIFIGSISGTAGSFDEAYAASKASLVGLTKSLAKKSRNNIRYNCLAPGLIEDTKMSKQLSDEEISNHKKQTPTGQLVQSDQIAKICVDLCKPHWNSLNGQVININGGRYV